MWAIRAGSISTMPITSPSLVTGITGGASIPVPSFQFDTNPRQEALRLAGILKTLYGTDEPKWASLRQKLETVPGVAAAAIRKIGINAGIAPDLIGKAQPVLLISKDDWDHKSFNTLVDEVLAFQPKDEKETVNV